LFRNAAKMTTYGIESELTAKLTEGLLLRLPLSYQHCKYNSFTSGDPPNRVDLSGLAVNRCPQWTATVDLNYTVTLGQLPGQFVFDAAANYISRNLDTYSLALPYARFTQTYADAGTLVDAAVTYNSADERWFAHVFVRNLTDRKSTRLNSSHVKISY